MKKRSDSGIRIEKRTTAGKTCWQTSLREGVTALLLFFALGTAGLCAFMPENMGSALPAALVGTAVCAGAALCGRFSWKKWAQPGFFALLLLLAALFSGRAADGLCLCWNAWCARRTAVTGVLRLGLSVMSEQASQSACVSIFLALAGALLAALCTWVVRHAHLAGAAACLLAAAALTALLGASAGAFAIFFPLAVCALLLTAPAQAAGGTAKLLGGAVLALVTALLLGALLQVPGMRDGSFFEAVREKTEKSLHVRRYETQPQTLPEGDFSSLGAKKSSGSVMLRVEMEKGEAMYLRGFTGARYTARGWEEISNETLAEKSSLLYWLHTGGFYPQTQTGLAASVLTDGSMETNTVTVTNAAACARYSYAPYMALTGSFPQALTQLRLEEGAILHDGARGAQTFRTVYAAPEKTVQWVEQLRSQPTPQGAAYLELESGYREFVNTCDLELSDEVRQTLSGYLDPIAAAHAGEPMTALLAVRCTQEFLDSALRYEENTAVLPEGADFAAFTLQNAAGYDFQYATLTVLALRYYGLPARYAEGYVLTQELAARAADGGVELTDENAHAWAEVYQEGIGWLPLEMTPGYADTMGSAPQAGALGTGISQREDAASSVGTMAGTGAGAYISEGASYDPQPEQDASPENDGDAPDQSHTPRTRFDTVRLLLWLLLPVLLLAIVFAALALRRRRTLKKRRAQFDDPDARNAAAWRFAYCARLLEALGFSRAGGSVLSLICPLAEGCGEDYAAAFRQMALINQRALFSTHAPAQEDLAAMAEFTQKTQLLLREKTPFMQRLRQKWLLCLY